MSREAGSGFAGKKFLILILGLSLTAASCDLVNGIFDFGGGGAQGVFKSEDSGETFRPAEVMAKKGDISTVTANALVFDTGNSSVLYLAASSGIYKSDDGAKTWRYILSGIAAADIAIDPFQANNLYASGIVGTNGKIIKSLDGGTSWVDIYTEPSKNNTVLAIAVSQTNPSLVLAGLNSGQIIRSTDGGHAWQATTDFADRIIQIKFSSSGTVYALTARKGVEKSSDQGSSWSSVSNSFTTDNLGSRNRTSVSAGAFYDLALDKRQSGVLYLGTDQGLFRTVNDGASWAFLSLPVRSSSTRVHAVAVNPSNSNNLFVAVSSTIFKSLNGGVSWETKVLPTNAGIRSILVDPQSNNNIYAGMGPAQSASGQ